jgi:pimeloyl-ACP methyl ester carboxylesterase
MEKIQLRKKDWRRYFMFVLLSVLTIVIIFCIVTVVQYNKDIGAAKEKLNSYPVQSINGEFGKMSYIDTGLGETILLSHGIFGGYDQAYESLKGFVGEKYRRLTPSRFGYPGSEAPDMPTPENQAKAFVELLDRLNIEKTYVICTSAGGASAIMMTIRYPERVKGLILVSSIMPNVKKTSKEKHERTGPPSIVVNDFPMWFTIKYFSFALNSMFGSKESSESIFATMLPVAPRKNGVRIETEVTNLDMDLNYEAYPVERIKVPMLMIHAKDDPMVKFESTMNFQKRTNTQTLIFETGGHLIEGHEDAIKKEINHFIEVNNSK